MVAPLPSHLPSRLPSRSAHVPETVPERLSDLRGPAEGVVALPLRLCWSGPRSFDVSQPARCLLMYQVVITEGQREDMETYLHPDHLLTVWPRLRGLLGPGFRVPWEERFPELSAAAEQAAPALREEFRRRRAAIEASYPR